MEAVRNCLKDRYCRSRQYILKKLINSGIDVNVILDSTEFSRNALHISVDKSTGEANQSLDLETSLLRGGCNTMVKDIIGRYPLHYAFAKHGNHKDSSFSDPIEVCSMLVETMKKKKGLDEADKFGGTPLMYAAYRGATVCCLLLIQVANLTLIVGYYFSELVDCNKNNLCLCILYFFVCRKERPM